MKQTVGSTAFYLWVGNGHKRTVDSFSFFLFFFSQEEYDDSTYTHTMSYD